MSSWVQSHPRSSELAVLPLALVAVVIVGVTLGLAPGLGFALVLAAGGVALAISRPDIAVLALLAYFPFETWLLKFVPQGSYALVVPDLISVALLLAVLLRVATSGDIRFLSRRHVAWIGLGLLSVTIASALVNPVPVIDEIYWVRVSLRFVPIGLVAAMEPWSGSIRSNLANVAFPVALVQCLIGLAELLGGYVVASFFWAGTAFSLGSIGSQADTLSTVEDRLVAGTMSHYNIYALTLLLLMGVMIADLLSGRVKQRPALVGGWSVVGLSAVMIVLSQSRQNVLALGVCLLVLGVSVWRKGNAAQRRMVSIGLVAIFALALVASASGRLAVADRFGRILEPNYWEQQMQADRGYAISTVAPTALANDPLLGAGPGSFHSSGSTGQQASGVARFGLNTFHSSFVGDVGWASFAAQVGLLGLLFVASLVVLPVAGARFERSTDSLLYLWTSAAFFMGMLGSTPLIYKPTSGILWCVFGLATASIVAGRAEVDTAIQQAPSC